jgi:ATP-dependent RNA helicase DeaD
LENFKNLGVSDAILAALERKGFVNPTPIQSLTIPHLLAGSTDLVAKAQTGTGKTAAFGIPILEKISPKGYVQAIVLTPTRELCLQVCDEITSLAPDRALKVCSVYGGQPIQTQIKALKKGADIVVGTPGRVIDMLGRNVLQLDQVRFVVLDEADEMLNMGFAEEVEEIMKQANTDRQMLLFSATMPKAILRLAESYMGEYEVLAAEQPQETASSVKQEYFMVHVSDKPAALCRILDGNPNFYGVVFCRTKVETGELATELERKGFSAEALNGDIAQNQRERILSKFRSGQTKILVATDVAARGIDVQDLTHVVNYSLPNDPESYVHRIGRTGRAGKEGIAISLVSPGDRRKLDQIKRITKADIEKGTLPTREEVLTARLKVVYRQVSEFEAQPDADTYTKLAAELLTSQDPQQLVATLLSQVVRLPEPGPSAKLKDKKERNSDRQDNGRNESRTNLSTDEARFKLAFGKHDNVTPAQLLSFIHEETGVKGSFIGRIDIHDRHSFLTASEEDARTIVKKLEQRFGKEDPIAQLAGGRGKSVGERREKKNQKKSVKHGAGWAKPNGKKSDRKFSKKR